MCCEADLLYRGRYKRRAIATKADAVVSLCNLRLRSPAFCSDMTRHRPFKYYAPLAPSPCF